MMKKLIFLIWLLFVSTAVDAATTIDAKIVRNQTGTGSCLISSGFPVPPGLVTEQIIRDGKVKILVGGVEVAANVSALRGRHADGTLRSILIQLTRTMAQNDELAASVIVDGGVRSNADPAYIRPTYEMVENNNIIAPTDKNYLVTTRITIRGLLPEGAGTTAEESFYTAMQSDRADCLYNKTGPCAGGSASTYDHPAALFSMWARSGNLKYQTYAISELLSSTWLQYNTALPSQTPACRSDAVANPDNRTPASAQGCGIGAEWTNPRYWSYAAAYLLTGYRDFWGIVAREAQSQQWNVTSQSAAYSEIIKYQDNDTPRLGYSTKYGALLAAMMIDATIPVPLQYNSNGRTYNWDDQLTWTIDTLEHWKWDFKWVPFTSAGGGTVPSAGTTISQGGVTATLMGVYETMNDEQNYPTSICGSRPANATIPPCSLPATGYLMVNNITGGAFAAGAITGVDVTATGAETPDYRSGLVSGSRQNSPRGLSRADNDANGPANTPIFQLVFPANFLIDTYLYFKRDGRIPAIIKKQVDTVLANIRPKEPDDVYYSWDGGVWGNHEYVKPYKLENPPQHTHDILTIPFELPEYARMLAFVLKTSGEDVVNGATYTQWYNRVINTANAAPNLMNWMWKYYGQFYSWGIDAPWMMAQTSLTNYGPATIRAPTQYNTIPGDTPDVYRDGSESSVNGSCGTSNNQSLSSSPTTNLCFTGTASSVSGSGPWSWTCAGSGGGSTASCSALLTSGPTVTTSVPQGRHTTSKTVTLTAEGATVIKYCLTTGCTPSTTYTGAFRVLINEALTIVRAQADDGAITEAVYKKQCRRGPNCK